MLLVPSTNSVLQGDKGDSLARKGRGFNSPESVKRDSQNEESVTKLQSLQFQQDLFVDMKPSTWRAAIRQAAIDRE